ncbi:16S rRNA (cytosine(967)-C(5))-methyltransferase RsmB [Caldimonas sp. KR1-144]|uniref:16S rRNA (cytosine(967)-C(5))-methyltransferase RsmB n=1 Tax=Caldimonas sp. KR1-144 TaxID=3400911 RepID=UPI003C028EF8
MSRPASEAGASAPLAVLLTHAADAVAAVRAGRSLTDALAAVPAATRAGTQALAFDALRELGRAQALRAAMVTKTPPPWVDALLLVALGFVTREADAAGSSYAPHTLVNQAVEAAKRRASAQSGLVNAVLRRALRERDALLASVAADPVARWNHPRWWIDRLRADWPEQWQAVLAANNARAPMTLRVNARRGDAASYVARLAEAGLAARQVGPQAVELLRPAPVGALPGFADGDVSVQDLAAQWAAPLLLGPAFNGDTPLAAGARVLDACAAPGGKTAHLLELAELDLLALDADAQRLARVDETLARLRLAARTRAADARDVAAWWDGRPFDAILLDAPCSASGIVRRHPDVRWLRRESDLDGLRRTQSGLLDALWPLLAPGGRLVYATCSVFRAEGAQQIDAFLQRAPDACPRPSPGHCLPLVDNADTSAAHASATDGFFYARIDKQGR